MSALEIEYSKKLFNDFLTPLELERFTIYFISNGMTEVEDIMSITEDNLRYIGITNDDHIKAILQAASAFNSDKTREAELREWLRKADLAVHFHGFLRLGVNSVEAAASLDPADETLDKLEVSLYGHRMRLQRRLRELKKKIEAANTVHEGHWAIPTTMAEEASKLFLCVTAVVKCPLDLDADSKSLQTQPLTFLVDTGSECCALTKEVIEQLKLPRKGVTTAVGVNTRVLTETYDAILEIGEKDIRVKVVAAETNAVGVDLFSKFSHVIDSKRHAWCNYQ